MKQKLRAAMAAVVIALSVVSMGALNSGCNGNALKAPEQLSPVGDVAFYAHRAIVAVDALQKVAIEGEAQAVISTNDARKIVEATKKAGEAGVALSAALSAAGDQEGAKKQAAAALKSALEDLPSLVDPDTAKLIRPYVSTVLSMLTVFGV